MGSTCVLTLNAATIQAKFVLTMMTLWETPMLDYTSAELAKLAGSCATVAISFGNTISKVA